MVFFSYLGELYNYLKTYLTILEEDFFVDLSSRIMSPLVFSLIEYTILITNIYEKNNALI